MPQVDHNVQQLVERFLTAFNRIEKFLRTTLSEKPQTSCSHLISRYSSANPRWRLREQLTVFAELRNFLVHEKTTPYKYIAVPSHEIVEAIERIEKSLLKPALVIPQFQRDVKVVQAKDSLLSVLEKIHRFAYSQFPVYSDGRFQGLLTENGITRWLARHTTSSLALVDFGEEVTESVLAEEEERPNWIFISRLSSQERALEMFSEKPRLEAVLITESGREREHLLGIITRWDALKLTSI